VTTGRRRGQGKRKRSEGPAVEDDGGEGRAGKASASGVVMKMLATPMMQGEPVSASAVVVTAVTAVDLSAVGAQRGGHQGAYAPGVEAVHVTQAAASAAAAAAASPIHQSSSSSKGGAGVSVGKGEGAPGAGQMSRLVDAAGGLETAMATARANAANAAEARAAMAATGGGGVALGDGVGSVGPASTSM
jgi:hypothetical protein